MQFTPKLRRLERVENCEKRIVVMPEILQSHLTKCSGLDNPTRADKCLPVFFSKKNRLKKAEAYVKILSIRE